VKYVNSEKLNEVVNELLSGLKPSDCIDQEEYRLSQDLRALPIGIDLWAYMFLTPDGEVIGTGWEPGELERSRDGHTMIKILVWGAERYPPLASLIPGWPPDSDDCQLCAGSGAHGTLVGSDQPAKCVWCGGLGWDISGA
jgi:hypothetical protein